VSHDVPRRALGRTGEQVSAIGLGGWHLALSHVSEASSLEIVRTAMDRGITFMDNCWDYNDGASEIRMGKALRDGYRQKAFVMTKIDGRSRKEAARQLDESLRRLQTDCIDLVQHHEIIRYEDPHRVFDEEGALDKFEAFASLNGARFHGLEPNAGTVTLERRESRIAEAVAVDDTAVVVFRGEETLPWSVA